MIDCDECAQIAGMFGYLLEKYADIVDDAHLMLPQDRNNLFVVESLSLHLRPPLGLP